MGHSLPSGLGWRSVATQLLSTSSGARPSRSLRHSLIHPESQFEGRVSHLPPFPRPLRRFSALSSCLARPAAYPDPLPESGIRSACLRPCFLSARPPAAPNPTESLPPASPAAAVGCSAAPPLRTRLRQPPLPPSRPQHCPQPPSPPSRQPPCPQPPSPPSRPQPCPQPPSPLLPPPPGRHPPARARAHARVSHSAIEGGGKAGEKMRKGEVQRAAVHPPADAPRIRQARDRDVRVPAQRLPSPRGGGPCLTGGLHSA
jgi:hypothetical protein